MIKVMSNRKIVAIADKPCYIRRKKDGTYTKVLYERDAHGIIVLGTYYNLPGHDEITRTTTNEETGETETVAAPEAYIFTVDGGEIAFKQQNKLAEVDETAVEGLMATTDLYEELTNKGVI